MVACTSSRLQVSSRRTGLRRAVDKCCQLRSSSMTSQLPGPPCEPCRLMFLEDFTAGGRSTNSGAAN